VAARAEEMTPNDRQFGWLEDVDSARALDWVAERNAASVAQIATDPRFPEIREKIREILDSEDRVPYITKIGDLWYNFRQDAAHQRGVWRRTTLESYRTESPVWETVIDLDALAAAEQENWVWHGAICLPPDYERCIVALSRGGADADVRREFDLVQRKFVEGGFFLPEAKSRVAWRDKDTLFVGTDLGPGSMTESGYPRQTRLWRRGTPLEQAELLFEGRPEDVAVGAFRDHTPGFERDLIYCSRTFRTTDVFLLHEGQLVQIDAPADATLAVRYDWLLLELRSDWRLGDRTYRQGSLLAARLEPWLAGDRTVHLLFQPSERVSLASFFFTRTYTVMSLLDNVRSRLLVASPKQLGSVGEGWAVEEVSTLLPYGSIDAAAVDADASDDIVLMGTDFLTPARLELLTLPSQVPEVLKSDPAFFDASRYEISQHHAISTDGTRIPYFQVSRKGLELNGRHPTLLYGYGGFEVSMTPAYSGSIGTGWLERGGVYVLANLRGGGEFGPAWHQAALREHRHRAYEDFAAVARHLIERGVTSPLHLGAMGGSNGGLLMGNVLVRYPDLFGAIVCQVPLLDMRRYHRLLAGASWVDEYGDPDDPEQWKFIQTFSPYHLVERGRLPPVLFSTSTRDDRVHPGHARKMVAKMLAQGHDNVFYYENLEGGHGAAANNAQRAFMSALSWTFLWRQLGS
jgi:prolyl oligopeptidase